jgi:hypothetical protein
LTGLEIELILEHVRVIDPAILRPAASPHKPWERNQVTQALCAPCYSFSEAPGRTYRSPGSGDGAEDEEPSIGCGGMF